MHPLVSVIIPTHNRADLLPRTVESVLAQHFDDFEVLVVDDGSTDNTAAVMESIHDPRVHYIRNEWTGHPSIGRNTGIRASRGRLLTFLDSDDLWLPDKLYAQADYLARNQDRHWCFTHFHFMEHETGSVTPRDIPSCLRGGDYSPRDLLRSNFIGSPTLMIRREALESCGAYDEAADLRFVEDWEFCLRLSALQPGGHLPEALALYRRHTSAATHAPDPLTNGMRCLAAMETAVKRNPDIYARHYHHAARSIIPPMAKSLLLRGRGADAAKLLDRAMKSPLRTPNLAFYRALAALPGGMLRPLLTLNRSLKAAIGH
ncbi:MAG: glycosyltransferase family 2 protein [Desulfovibrionaceae bacterium]